VDQHFVTAYCAWSNGAVERVNREIIALTRKLLAEKCETLTTWPKLIPFSQSTLKQRKSKRLGGWAPIEVFMHHRTSEPLDVILPTGDDETWERVDIDKVPGKLAMVKEHMEKISLALDDAYTTVRTCSEQRQYRNQKRAAQHAEGFHGEIGDYMLVAMATSDAERKLVGIWKGPYQLVAHQNKKVEVLRTIVGEKKEFKVYHRRLKRYRPADSLLLDQWKQQAAYNGGCLELEEIKEARWSIEEERLELLVSWCGLAECTWESWDAIVDIDPHSGEQCLIKIIRDWPNLEDWCKQIAKGPFGTPGKHVNLHQGRKICLKALKKIYRDTFGDANAYMDWKAQIEEQVEKATSEGKRLPRALARLE
jgi:hypothetical protein